MIGHQELDLQRSPDFHWSFGDTLEMTLSVIEDRLVGSINGQTLLTAHDSALDAGAVGLVVSDGRSATHKIRVSSPD